MKFYHSKIEYRLKQLGRKKGWLADEIGIKSTNLTRILHGKVNFGISTFIKLCESLEVNPSYFFVPMDLDNEDQVSEPSAEYSKLDELSFLKKENALLKDQIDLYRKMLEQE